jgi:SPP1 gp7 family putative phage head morphogenesis protein
MSSISINDNLFDRIIDHSSDVRLYEEGVQLQNRRIVKRHRKKLKHLLTGNIRADATKEVNRFGRELLVHQTSSLKEFSTSQLDFHTQNIDKEVGKFYNTARPRSKEFLTEITGPNIKGSRSITNNIKNISSAELVRIQTRVRGGLAKGLTEKEIINDVLKTTKITEHQAKTLTRTAITSTQTLALRTVADQNKDLISGFIFTAILDSRTSPVCSYHNGKFYTEKEAKNWEPPLHFNCRSTLVPVLKSKEDLLNSNTSKLKKTELTKLDPSKMTGQPPKTKGFTEWLRGQKLSVQEKFLGGVEKAILFKTGALKVADYVTPKGKGLSIAALRKKAAIMTSIFPTKQKLRETKMGATASTPNSLLNNPKHKSDLRNVFLQDSDDYNSTLALTDFKGTSLVGKQASRRRVANEFDERNFSADPMTGEVKNNNLYDPDYTLLQERTDFMKGSKLISNEQKVFIEDMANSLEGKISVNQQTVVTENLRVVFERFAKDKTKWKDLSAVVKAENRFAVQNVSRLLDTRSRKRSSLFSRFMTDDTPKIQIMGDYYTFDSLQKNLMKDQKYINNWRNKEGVDLAKKAYLTGRAPMRTYFSGITDKYPTKKRLVKRLRKDNPTWAKLYDKYILKKKKVPTDSWISRTFANGREQIRRIIDLELSTARKKPTSKLVDEKALNVITKATKLIVSGQSTDYDALAINIGKMYSKEFININPLAKHTLKDYHKEGSKLLDMMVGQNLIKVGFRGRVRRGVLDADTGRASGSWGDTIGREVTVVDKKLLELQRAERRAVVAGRLGIVSDRDRLYVKAGNTTYTDARGRQTSKSFITRNASATFPKEQIDRDFANMLNQVMDTQYEVDAEFFDFMDKLVRFRDPAGDTKKWDSLNEFRHLILKRGEQGYGMMSTAKWHRQRGKPFRTPAQIDGRGRVYHTGYLSPTGGETVRPFLNSARKTSFTPEALTELRIQTGAMIGPSTEALTEAGRIAIFKRNEKGLREIGEILTAKTQKDRRVREFLSHPLVRQFEGEEVPKFARLALEYSRVHKHVDGNLDDIAKLKTYKTQLMIENDASSSGAQIIGLSTRDRDISMNSNVLATDKKNRLYDLVAQDTANDPELLKIPALRDADIDWEDLAKAAKAQNMVN